MADELKQLTQYIKNSADERYALKSEVPTASELEEARNFIINIHREDITKNYTGLTDQEVIDLVESKTADIANATTAIQHPTLNVVTNYITLYNETAPITNNTIWKDEVEVQSYNPYWSHVLPIKDNKFITADTNSSGKLLQLNNDNTISELATFDANYALCATFDGKRVVTVYSGHVYQYDLQEDGTYTRLDISQKIESGYLGYLYYGSNLCHLKWDGKVLYAWGKVYKIAEDGSWVQDNTIPNMIRRLDNESYVGWINFVLPDLSLNMVYKSRGYDNKVHFFSLQSDGTYAEDPVLELDSGTKIIYGQLTLDGKKLVCTVKDTNDKYAMETYYRNADKTWTFISRNYSQTNNLELNAPLLTLDGKKAFVKTSNYKLLMFEQQIDVNALDANSTDPFDDGSLKHFWKLDSDTVDTITNTTGSITGTITYVPAKFDTGAKVENGENRIDTTLSTPVFKDGTPATIAFWYKDIDSGSAHHRILGKRDINDNSCVFEIYCNNRDTLNFAYLDGANWIDLGFSYAEDMTTKLKHVAFSYDGTDISMYIDGELKETRSNQFSGITQTSDAFNIGAASDDAAYFPNGILDHVQVFNRALTQEEVNTLATAINTSESNNTELNASNTNPELFNNTDFSVSSDGSMPDNWDVVTTQDNSQISDNYIYQNNKVKLVGSDANEDSDARHIFITTLYQGIDLSAGTYEFYIDLDDSFLKSPMNCTNTKVQLAIGTKIVDLITVNNEELTVAAQVKNATIDVVASNLNDNGPTDVSIRLLIDVNCSNGGSGIGGNAADSNLVIKQVSLKLED
jgi:hypothetical protein